MTPPPSTWLWFQWVLLLGVEIATVCLIAALVQRWISSAAWRRTIWQAAAVAMLGIVLFEVSGAARKFAVWTVGPTADRQPTPPNIVLSADPSVDALHLDERFRRRIETTIAANRDASASTVPNKPVHEIEPPSQSGLVSGLQPTPNSPRLNTEPESPSAASPGMAARTPQPARADSSDPINSVLVGFFCCAWALGFLFLAGRTILTHGLLMIFRCRRHSTADAALLERVQLLARGLGITAKIRVLQSAALTGPIAFGWFRPTIGLPLSFSEITEPVARDAMLAHEMAHLSARDPLWHLVADVTTALLWWHPAAWWTRRQLHLTSEAAADEASLLVRNGPQALAECLVELGKRLSATEPLGGLGVIGYRSHLGRRVQTLLHLEGSTWKPLGRISATLVRSVGPMAVVALVILCSAWAAPRALTKGENMKTLQQSWKHSLATFVLLATLNSAEVPAADTPRPSPPPPVVPPPPGYGVSEFGAPDFMGVTLTTGPKPNSALAAKLEGIVLDEVAFDGLPLQEVLRMLSDEARKRDPEKKGINFLLNPNQPPTIPDVGPFGGPAAIDPTTGRLLPSPASEAIDIGQVQVKFNLPLRRVTMKNLLAAIVKVADHPIDYSLEDYGVVFSLKPQAAVLQYGSVQPVAGAPTQSMLQVATFKVDTNTFVAGLASAFGIKLDTTAAGELRSSKIKTALRELLTQLGISMDGQKAIFYNELTGVLMVRATDPDLMVVKAAIQTLGGNTTAGNAIFNSGMDPNQH